MRLHLLLCGIVLVGLCGCGTPGAPQPPSLKLPAPVTDLEARRKGAQVTLTWTPPTQTTDRENIRQAGQTEVCRAVGELKACGTPVASLADAQVEHWTKSTIVGRKDFTDTLPAEWIAQNPTGFATYALEDRNARGRAAGLSNEVKVSLAPTLPAPSELQAKVTQDGVELSWSDENNPTLAKEARMGHPSLSFLYRVFRQTEGENKPEVIAGEVGGEATSYVDHSAEWEKTYAYRVAPVTRVKQNAGEAIEVEGDDASVNVDVHDVFPPAVPTGVQAVFSGVGQKPFMDLTWAPNLEQDLAGYNVYRREAGTEAQKINSDLVKTPAFRDDKVEAGHQYFYSVSAVDERGNESGRSEEANETVK